MERFAVLINKNPSDLYKPICKKVKDNVGALRTTRQVQRRDAGKKLEAGECSVKNYEQIYLGSSITEEQVDKSIRDAIKSDDISCEVEMDNGRNEKIYYAKSGSLEKYLIASVCTGNNRFTRLDAPGWAAKKEHTHIYIHRESGLHYVADRNGIIVRRYVKRAIAKRDLDNLKGGCGVAPHVTGSRRRFPTEKELTNYSGEHNLGSEKAITDAQKVRFHLSQGSNRMISTSSTKHETFGSQGTPFSKGDGNAGVILIDLLNVNRNIIVDVHNPDALINALGFHKKYNWRLAYEADPGSRGHNQMFKDTIRTREILIDGWIPIGSVIYVSDWYKRPHWWLDDYTEDDKKIIKEMYPEYIPQ